MTASALFEIGHHDDCAIDSSATDPSRSDDVEYRNNCKPWLECELSLSRLEGSKVRNE